MNHHLKRQLQAESILFENVCGKVSDQYRDLVLESLGFSIDLAHSVNATISLNDQLTGDKVKITI